MQDNNTPTPTDATPPTTPEVTPAPGSTPVVPEVTAAPEATPAESNPVSPSPVSDTTNPSTNPTPEAATAAVATAPAAAATEHTPGAKNHLVAVLLSIFVGGLGVDRFYLGHIGLGVAKLLLSWLTFGIWWLVDVILIATRRVKNVTWEN